MKNYLKGVAFRTVLVLAIVILSAKYLQVDFQTPFVELRSPIVITVMYDKHLEPRENSMADLKNGKPIEVDEEAPIPMQEDVFSVVGAE